jgi:hypothetical protein
MTIKNDETRQRTPDVPGTTGSPRTPQPEGAAHTPGPWRVVDDGSRCDGVWVSPPDGAKPVICDLIGRVFDREAGCSQITPEDEANARLIAAAPEMYEALKAARTSLAASAEASHLLDGFTIGGDGLPRANRTVTTEDGLIQTVDAAIAKAEGR